MDTLTGVEDKIDERMPDGKPGPTEPEILEVHSGLMNQQPAGEAPSRPQAGEHQQQEQSPEQVRCSTQRAAQLAAAGWASLCGSVCKAACVPCSAGQHTVASSLSACMMATCLTPACVAEQGSGAGRARPHWRRGRGPVALAAGRHPVRARDQGHRPAHSATVEVQLWCSDVRLKPLCGQHASLIMALLVLHLTFVLSISVTASAVHL